MNDNYTLRVATLEDSYEIWKIMDFCAKSMEHKEHFICDDLDYVKDILSGHGLGVVVCDKDGEIVGNLLVKYPGLDEENLGYDVFVRSKKDHIHNISLNADDCNQVITTHDDSICLKCTISLTSENLMRVFHMDSASVLPEHRGHGLESRMIAAQQKNNANARRRFVAQVSKLDALSPLKVLTRGYAMVSDSADHIIRSADAVSAGDEINVRFSDGVIRANVIEGKMDHE